MPPGSGATGSAAPGRGAVQGGPSRVPARIQEAVVFSLFYLWLWRVVEPHLLFHGAGSITNFPSFYTTWRFFLEHTAYPGGLTEYLSAFLSQLFYHSWLGALVVTFQAWGFCLAIGYLLEAVGLGAWRAARYVPAMLLLVVYGKYTYHFPPTLALLVALLLACAAFAAMRRWPLGYARIIAFVVASLACYGLAGGAFLVFACLCVMREGLFVKDRGWAMSYAVSAAAMPYVVGILGFGVSVVDAYTRLLPFSWRVLYYEPRSRYVTVVYAMVALVPAVWAAGSLGLLLRARVQQRTAKGPRGSGRRTGRRRAGGRVGVALSWIAAQGQTRWLVRTAAVTGAAAVVAIVAFDPREKTRFEVDYYAYHKRWPEVLAEARKHPDNHFVMHAVDRALYHTGRLGSEMFQWPQEPGFLFLTGSEYKRVFWQTFDVYLDLGLVNLAEHALTESLEGFGDRPMILQRLAMVNMVKGNLGTARVYLGALAETLFHRDWAGAYLTLIETDPELSSDPQVQALRSMSLGEDHPTIRLPEEQMLRWLLNKNSRNQMAFEYLESWFLLNRQLPKFVESIGGLRAFGYAELPRYYEEAMLIYVLGSRKRLDLNGYKPSDQLQRRADEFSRIVSQYAADRQATLREMQNHHRDTYFFYYLRVLPEKAR